MLPSCRHQIRLVYLFEEGAYEVVSFGSSDETIGESVTIMLNENFITNGIRGFYFKHNTSVTCSTAEDSS